MGATYDMYINQGENYAIQLVIKDQAGDPIDITGDTFEGQIRDKYDASSIAATFVFENGPSTGSLFVKLSSEATGDIPCAPGTMQNKRPVTEFVYDIERHSSGAVTRILEGSAFVSPEVTR